MQQKEESFQSNKPCKNQESPEFCEIFEINDLKAQLQAKTTLIYNMKNQIKSVKKASNEPKTKDHNDSLIAQVNSKTIENADLKAQIQEMVFANVALKNELRKLKGNSMDTKFAKPSILGKLLRFASQVDVNNDLSKPVTTHYLPKERESAVAKPHHMIAPGSSRYSSNDMVHNHYLEEAKKKTQESSTNSDTSVMPFARSQSTANGSKPKPRINNQSPGIGLYLRLVTS
ncbi:hypothetical protein Tco_1547529 [Tanacetum coccineum]